MRTRPTVAGRVTAMVTPGPGRIRFAAEVMRARWDASSARWHLSAIQIAPEIQPTVDRLDPSEYDVIPSGAQP